MIRLSALAAGLLLATSAFAGQPAATAQTQAMATAQPILVASAPAAADRVYPPLPSLSMIPVSTSEDEIDEAPARPAPSSTSSRKKKGHVVVERRQPMPVARLVVSDESRIYLRSIEHQLDQALAHEPATATATASR